MADYIYDRANGRYLAEKIINAFPTRNVRLSVATYPNHGDKKVEQASLKLKGITSNSDGLIFTFERGKRHTLLPLKSDSVDTGKVSLVTKEEPRHSWDKRPYKTKVTFIDSQGAQVVIVLK